MNHRIKTGLFKMLDSLPQSIGSGMYHTLQRLYNSETVEFSIRNHHATLVRFQAGLERYGLTFKDQVIVEIGSGWLPVTPYDLLGNFHAKEILTYDISDHYQRSKIKTLNRLFNHQCPGGFPTDTRIDPRVIYYPKTNIISSPPTRKANVVISRNVLEHVTPQDIFAMHKNAHQYLDPEAFIVHQISPSDHRAYSDQNLSLWDFLKYSEEEWNEIQTRFDYHNRLRLPQYLQIFNEAGYDVIQCDYNSQKDPHKLPAKIHTDFKQFSTEELTAGNIFVILKRTVV